MHVAARIRHVLARRPWLYWLGVLLVAALAAFGASRAVDAVDDARRAWGSTQPVVVATGDLAPGTPLAGSTTVRALPVPMVPPASLGEVPDGAVARHDLAEGEVLVDTDIAPSGSPRALIPAGWSAVAVAEAVPTGARVGDAVTALGEGVVLAPDGVVVGYAGEGVLVAVPDADAPAVAMAAAAGQLVLALRP